MSGTIWHFNGARSFSTPETLSNGRSALQSRMLVQQHCTRQQRRHVARADLTAGFLEAVAAAALQTRLQRHSLVRARIDCDGFTLLRGRVRSVSIAGRDWISPLGLSAVILEVSLGMAELDVAAILQQQRIMLQGVPLGVGRIVFTASQFGSFLRHPLMTQAAAAAVQGHCFEFDSEATFDATSGAVLMAGLWHGDGVRYRLRMAPEGAHAIVRAAIQHTAGEDGFQATRTSEAPDNASSGTAAVATALTAFFSGLTLNLQGPELRYAGMQLVAADELDRRAGVLPASFQGSLPPLAMGAGIAAGRDPVLDLRLSCRVLGFPPANPHF